MYGLREDCKRYEEFKRIVDSKSSVDHPWFIVGVFNEMFLSSEEFGGKDFDFNKVRKLRSFVDGCEVLFYKSKMLFIYMEEWS